MYWSYAAGLGLAKLGKVVARVVNYPKENFALVSSAEWQKSV